MKILTALLSLNIKQLVKIRFHIINQDSIESDSFGGVRFNKAHYEKVLHAKQELLKNKLN